QSTIPELRSFAPLDSRARLATRESCLKRSTAGSFRICNANKAHFPTFCTNHRWILPERVRSIILDSCLHDHGTKIDLLVVVVMPDHVHVIFTPLVNEQAKEVCSLARIMDAIKGSSAHKINKALDRKGRVWQAGSFDHVLRSSESLDEKVRYILENTGRQGLVREWEDYPWVWQKA